MARIDSQMLFLTTSPRTPEKMVPEIELLVKHFEGKRWNIETQRAFMGILSEEQFFNGNGQNDPAFSARDRINRAPKSLGFVSLSPIISLTSAGKALISSKRKGEILLRQLLKFQIPSPYHKPSVKAATFCVKPYLEILRLIRTMGTLKFDELQIFGMQLTDWHRFEEIVTKIEKFRIAKVDHKGGYRAFKTNYLHDELKCIYAERIARGETQTRESNEVSLEKFLKTQSSNMRDYADACFRYLRATGMVNVSHVGKSLSIEPGCIEDVDFILKTVDRNPCYVNDGCKYVEYLGNAGLPLLLTDDRLQLMKKLHTEFPEVPFDEKLCLAGLKDLYIDLVEQRKNNELNRQIAEIKDYRLYNDIQDLFEQIERNGLYDAPLMLEWNVWRAMTMLDGGNIKANLNFDDFGKPISTAQGNMADIVCDYDDFILTVEVTLASGQKQYEMESEPVSRHLGKIKKSSNKPCYCLFIAPVINEACIAHFYALHNMNITYYGGRSVIVPLPLSVFRKMVEDSYKADYIPNHEQVHRLFEYSEKLVQTCENELQWFNEIKQFAMNWLK